MDNHFKPKVVLLSSWRSPYLVPYIEELTAVGIEIHSIIYIEKKNNKSLQVFKDRVVSDYVNKSIFELEALHIPCYFFKNINSHTSLEFLKNQDVDLMVNAGVSSILKTDILKVPKIGIVNSHPGLFPKYRGCCCVEWAIYNDDQVGASCHFINENIDAGPLIYSEGMPVYKEDSYEMVRTRMIKHAARVLAKGCLNVFHQNLNPSNMPKVSTDSYYKIIPDEFLSEVKKKLIERRYQKYSET